MTILLVLLACVACAFNGVSAGSSYDFKFGNASLWHSEVTYCDPSTYLTRTYVGYTSGFKPTYKIEDKSKSTYGYVGYQSSLSAVFVTFRGSEDINNWVTNLDVVTTSYPSCSGCEVHKGFNDAEKAVFSGILSAVKSLKSSYPSASVVVTGHSLGAALATLTALDLLNSGVTGVKVFNYGSPRVGNTKFADWASTKLSFTRSTHYKDMVVHCPMHERFTHLSTEIYEDLHSGGPLRDCVGHEDATCAYQWSVTSIDDHLLYQGLTMGGSGCAAVSK